MITLKIGSAGEPEKDIILQLSGIEDVQKAIAEYGSDFIAYGLWYKANTLQDELDRTWSNLEEYVTELDTIHEALLSSTKQVPSSSNLPF